MRGLPRPPAPPAAWRLLLPAGLAEIVLLAALGWCPAADTPGWRALFFAGAFAAYAVAASRVKDARGGAALIWVTAVAMRLVLLPLDPSLSTDAYRYLWDGHIQVAGLGPFGRSPLDPDLAGLRTPWFHQIPEPGSVTPFPPLAQISFLILSLAGGALLQAKLLWVGLDLATGWVLARIAHHTGRSRRLTQLLWLWSPLLVLEVAWSGHLIPLVTFPLALAVLLARVPAASGIALGLGSMVAPASLAALPALARRSGYRFLVGCLAAMAVVAAPYALAGRALLTAPARIFLEGRFLEGPYLLVESAIPGDTAPRLVALALVLGVSVWAAWRRMRIEAALLWVLGASLLVTPVLRPWYALWILPFAALRLAWPWILFTGLAFLPYVAFPVGPLPGSGPVPVWVHLAVWLPLVALLVRELWRTGAARFPSPAAPGS
ncbi:MAG: hypothetical protein ACYC6F_13960 [Longimicrobiales bacterium]